MMIFKLHRFVVRVEEAAMVLKQQERPKIQVQTYPLLCFSSEIKTSMWYTQPPRKPFLIVLSADQTVSTSSWSQETIRRLEHMNALKSTASRLKTLFNCALMTQLLKTTSSPMMMTSVLLILTGGKSYGDLAMTGPRVWHPWMFTSVEKKWRLSSVPSTTLPNAESRKIQVKLCGNILLPHSAQDQELQELSLTIALKLMSSVQTLIHGLRPT